MEKDVEVATEWFRSAALSGDPSAMAAYGDALDRVNSDRDHDRDDDDEEEDAARREDEDEDEDAERGEDDDEDEDGDDNRRKRPRTKRRRGAAGKKPAARSASTARTSGKAAAAAGPRVWWHRAADAGHPGAMVSLGVALLEAARFHGGSKAAALTWLERAASVGDAYAMEALARAAADGYRHDDDAERWYTRAYDKGRSAVAVERARTLFDNLSNIFVTERKVLVAAWVQRAAEAGDVDAMQQYAMCAYLGIGVQTSIPETARWTRTAAEAGDVRAMMGWASCLRNGLGVPRNHAESIHWYLAAAENGDSDALYRLGQSYFVGAGVGQDVANAVAFYRRAAIQRHADACAALGRCLLNGWGLPAPDPLQGFHWIAEAAALGHGYATALLSLHAVESGAHPERHVRTGFRLAAASSDPAAMVALGWLFGHSAQDGADSDWRAAGRWFRHAADLGDPEGQVRLGECYEHGRGVEVDVAVARTFYQAAAAMGDVAAKLKLAQIDPAAVGTAPATRPGRRARDGGAAKEATADRYGLDHPLAKGAAVYYRAASARNAHDAKVHVDAAADLGFPKAMAARGIQLVRDPATSKEGRAWLEKSVIGGAYSGMTALATLLARDSSPASTARALQLCQAAAGQDYAPAMIMLGEAYLHGRLGLRADRDEGLGWLQRAATGLNSADAMVALASAHLRLTQAARAPPAPAITAAVLGWLREAIDLRHGGAAVLLGWLHLQGMLVDRNADLAVSHFKRCIDGRDMQPTRPAVLEATVHLGMTAQYGWGGGIVASDETARTWYSFVEHRGGMGQSRNPTWNREKDEDGNGVGPAPFAPIIEGKELELRTWDKPDKKRAFALYNEAAEGTPSPASGGSMTLQPTALFLFAQCHQHGVGTRADRAKGAEYYQRAVDAGCWLAREYLDVVASAGGGVASAGGPTAGAKARK